jgi:hypothetical protein
MFGSAGNDDESAFDDDEDATTTKDSGLMSNIMNSVMGGTAIYLFINLFMIGNLLIESREMIQVTNDTSVVVFSCTGASKTPTAKTPSYSMYNTASSASNPK